MKRRTTGQEESTKRRKLTHTFCNRTNWSKDESLVELHQHEIQCPKCSLENQVRKEEDKKRWILQDKHYERITKQRVKDEENRSNFICNVIWDNHVDLFPCTNLDIQKDIALVLIGSPDLERLKFYSMKELLWFDKYLDLLQTYHGVWLINDINMLLSIKYLLKYYAMMLIEYPGKMEPVIMVFLEGFNKVCEDKHEEMLNLRKKMRKIRGDIATKKTLQEIYQHISELNMHTFCKKRLCFINSERIPSDIHFIFIGHLRKAFSDALDYVGRQYFIDVKIPLEYYNGLPLFHFIPFRSKKLKILTIHGLFHKMKRYHKTYNISTKNKFIHYCDTIDFDNINLKVKGTNLGFSEDSSFMHRHMDFWCMHSKKLKHIGWYYRTNGEGSWISRKEKDGSFTPLMTMCQFNTSMKDGYFLNCFEELEYHAANGGGFMSNMHVGQSSIWKIADSWTVFHYAQKVLFFQGIIDQYFI